MVAAPRMLALWLAALVLVCAGPARAQQDEVSVQANVDRSQVRENESFTYVLRAEGRVRSEPDAQPLTTDFDILNRSSSQRIRIVNGETREIAEWMFQLMPKRAGHLTLPPLRVGGALSNPVDVEVLPAIAAGAVPADIFMEIESDPPGEAYVQSQIVFTLRLYLGIGTGRRTMTAPQVEGGEAILERLGDDRQYRIVREGRDFTVVERRYAVFPQETGTLTIGPATFEALVVPDRGFSRVQRLRSESMQIDVLPAVAPPPEFPNAAWLPARGVRISERWSDEGRPFEVGVPRTRTITVAAEGLLETQLPELELESSQALRQYPDQPDLERTVTADGIEAARTERYAVIAQSAGDARVAGVELPWFDIDAERWEVARLDARSVNVLPGAAPDPVAPARAGETAAEAPASAADAGPGYWPWVSAFLALGWLLTAVYAVRGRTRRAPSRPAPRTMAPRRAANRQLLRQLRRACDAGDAAETQRLLMEWAALRFPDEPPKTLGALAAKLPPEAAREIHALESHLYGARAQPWNGEGLSGALSRVDSVSRPGPDEPPDPLLPLYR